MFCFASAIRVCDVLLKLPFKLGSFLGMLKDGPVRFEISVADQAESVFVHSVLTDNRGTHN